MADNNVIEKEVNTGSDNAGNKSLESSSQAFRDEISSTNKTDYRAAISSIESSNMNSGSMGLPQLSIVEKSPGSIKGTDLKYGTKVNESPEDEKRNHKTVTRNPDGSTLTTTSNADGTKEVVAKDSSGKESYKVKFDKEGRASSVQERHGYEWKSTDGGKTWKAHENGKPVEGDPWKGTVSVDDKGNLVQKSVNGTIYTRQTDGTKITQYPQEKDSQSARIEVEKPDGSKNVKLKDGSSYEIKDGNLTAYDKDGKVVAQYKNYEKALNDHLAKLTSALTSGINKSNTPGFYVGQAIPEMTARILTAPLGWVQGEAMLPGTGISQHHDWQKNVEARKKVIGPGLSPDGQTDLTPKNWQEAFNDVQGRQDQLGKRWGNCAEQAASLAHLIHEQILKDPAMADCKVRQVHSSSGSHSWVEVKHPNGSVTIHDPWANQSGTRENLEAQKERYNDPNRKNSPWYGR